MTDNKPRRPLEDGELIDDITLGKNQVAWDPETRVLGQCRRCSLPYEIVAHGRTAAQALRQEPHCVICTAIVKRLSERPPRSPLFWGTMLILVGLLVTLGVAVLFRHLG